MLEHNNSDQQLSEEQAYQETVRGVRSDMGWNQIHEFESSASSRDDNSFASHRSQLPRKSLQNCHLMTGYARSLRN